MTTSFLHLDKRIVNGQTRFQDNSHKLSHRDFQSAILDKIASNDKSFIEDCIERYGKTIWAVSKKFSDSAGDAEKLTSLIFSDLWKSIGNLDCREITENQLILMITLKALKKNSSKLM